MQDWGSVNAATTKRTAGAFVRRAVLVGLMATGAFALSGCQTMMSPRAPTSAQGEMAEPVHKLMASASQRAFAKLEQPDGFWSSSVARINLPVLFAKTRGRTSPLRSPEFREKLQHLLNNLAEEGARKGGPLVIDSAKSVPVPNGTAILRGRPTAATTLLRQSVGPALVNAMIPAILEEMQANQDPTLGKAMASLSGVTMTDAAHALAIEADNAVWYEIGAAETEIRSNPASTNDAGLISALSTR
ncbi:hypothetical protein WSK_1256 [Novosphingobium sp. Rr 2-17]|nr:hypothetical protein WSK_1256 [Novosphingobium sp. Rr 2-17]